jgi:hypothetical protein
MLFINDDQLLYMIRYGYTQCNPFQFCGWRQSKQHSSTAGWQ